MGLQILEGMTVGVPGGLFIVLGVAGIGKSVHGIVGIYREFLTCSFHVRFKLCHNLGVDPAILGSKNSQYISMQVFQAVDVFFRHAIIHHTAVCSCSTHQRRLEGPSSAEAPADGIDVGLFGELVQCALDDGPGAGIADALHELSGLIGSSCCFPVVQIQGPNVDVASQIVLQLLAHLTDIGIQSPPFVKHQQVLVAGMCTVQDIGCACLAVRRGEMLECPWVMVQLIGQGIWVRFSKSFVAGQIGELSGGTGCGVTRLGHGGAVGAEQEHGNPGKFHDLRI